MQYTEEKHFNFVRNLVFSKKSMENQEKSILYPF